MNETQSMAAVLLVELLVFTGCASDQFSGTGTPTPEQETSEAQSSATPSDTSASTDILSSTEETAGSFQPIPIKDLPAKKGYPYAIKTRWPGVVRSPYAQDKFLDVSKLAQGSFARCRHTGKIFVVP